MKKSTAAKLKLSGSFNLDKCNRFDSLVFKRLVLTVCSNACNLFYNQMYETIMNGAPLYVTPEKAAKVIELIEVMHAQNPLPVKY